MKKIEREYFGTPKNINYNLNGENMKISIADFNFDIKNRYPFTERRTIEYSSKDIAQESDYNFENTLEEIEKELKLSDDSAIALPHAEVALLLRKISKWLPNNNAFVLHSACFDVGGEGVAFAAHSGTGKTTHMRLWQQLLGEKMVVVNGDKPIVRFFEGEPRQPYAYGTPWNGKEQLGCNMRTPLKHICFIERSETNYVEKVDKKAIVNRIFNQVYMPEDSMSMLKTMQLIDRLVTCCDLWIIHCNMDPEAAKVAYEAILGNNGL